jgi:hypothetical protein
MDLMLIGLSESERYIEGLMQMEKLSISHLNKTEGIDLKDGRGRAILNLD